MEGGFRNMVPYDVPGEATALDLLLVEAETFIKTIDWYPDPMINAVMIGLALGACLMSVPLFFWLICCACTSSNSAPPPKTSKTGPTKGANDDVPSKDTPASAPSADGVKKRKPRATTE